MIIDCLLQAKWIYPVSRPAIENGIVEIRAGRIVALGSQRTRSAKAVDLGEVALIPGLVNAHTHLEFCDLRQPLGSRGMEFTDWIKLVIEARADESRRETTKSQTIDQGILESTNAGVVAIGEIASEPVHVEDYRSAPLAIVFLERLGRNPNGLAQTTAAAESWLDRMAKTGSPENTICAISPHAPYSVHPQLLAMTIEQSRRFGCPVAMHLAESREELQLLETQTGPFVPLLESLGAWFPKTYRPGTRIIDFLTQLSRAPRSLVVHGNYLGDADVEYVAQHSETMSIVYCPRTHEYFGHQPYPLRQFLAAGINVAIGTDSRASSPDLRLFEELKMIQREFPEIDDQTILEMGTSSGAMALGLNATIAALEPGGTANLNLVALSDHPRLFQETAECVPIARHPAFG